MQGPNHSHLEQGAARPLPLSSAACREASLRRSWPQQRVVQVIVAPKLGSGESMPDRAGVGAMLGKAHLGDRSHTPIRQYQIWAFAAVKAGMAETGAANINTRSGPKHKRCRGLTTAIWSRGPPGHFRSLPPQAARPHCGGLGCSSASSR